MRIKVSEIVRAVASTYPWRKHFLTRHDILLEVRFELLSIRIEAALRLLKRFLSEAYGVLRRDVLESEAGENLSPCPTQYSVVSHQET